VTRIEFKPVIKPDLVVQAYFLRLWQIFDFQNVLVGATNKDLPAVENHVEPFVNKRLREQKYTFSVFRRKSLLFRPCAQNLARDAQGTFSRWWLSPNFHLKVAENRT
jgi:hypothetical protein